MALISIWHYFFCSRNGKLDKMGQKLKTLANIKQLVTLKRAKEKDGRNLLPEDLDPLTDASVVYNEEEILWVGPSENVPSGLKESARIDCSKFVVTPEVVDCHTHLVFGGNRAKEYFMRLNGADYQELAKNGGGILSTVKATNQTSFDELRSLACERINRIHSFGIGGIEIKSGYGLNREKEEELSYLIDDLKRHYAKTIQIKNTFLAAHAIPPEYSSSRQYLTDVVLPLLERLVLKNIIDAVDIFHEEGYFNDKDATLLYQKAQELNIPIKCHADEFMDNKAALLACHHGAISADHLLKTESDGLKALAESSTVATLLPGTGFFLGEDQAQAREFLDRGIKVAIGSDYNPGSCHFDNVLMCASFAAPLYKMNMAELWCSLTLNAACAMGLANQGAVVPRLRPRFSFFQAQAIDEITYNWGKNLAIWPTGA